MKVLLTENVKGLGKAGDVCDVKDGYAMNFLIAKNLALQATNEILARYKAQQRKKAEVEAAQKAEYEALAKKLAAESVVCHAKVGNNGMLQGAITKEHIAELIHKAHNVMIDKKGIELSNPIKSTGLYDLEVKLGLGVKATIKLDVQGE
ncbi:MAG: 50S ribosomal protein L9 [Helicobacter sp.]|nr:50S ribosomal protein L9 [Helicobacter sp.]